jgi:hypothetical protein
MYFVCVGITALEAAAAAAAAAAADDGGVGVTQLSCMQRMLVSTQPAVLLYTVQLLLSAH